uniref:Membrane protein ORF71 n=1 Tax=Anguillid herpesvirus 1 TaxID=150286 RepID=A0A8E5ALA7_9VIRU|nr:membrane protein ORF71 [Anguillid herpesvirus 1]
MDRTVILVVHLLNLVALTLSQGGSVWGLIGDQITLTPPDPPTAPIVRIVWKHGDDKAIEFDDTIVGYRQFVNATLNLTSGELTLTNLDSRFAGTYTADINGVKGVRAWKLSVLASPPPTTTSAPTTTTANATTANATTAAANATTAAANATTAVPAAPVIGRAAVPVPINATSAAAPTTAAPLAPAAAPTAAAPAVIVPTTAPAPLAPTTAPAAAPTTAAPAVIVPTTAPAPTPAPAPLAPTTAPITTPTTTPATTPATTTPATTTPATTTPATTTPTTTTPTTTTPTTIPTTTALSTTTMVPNTPPDPKIYGVYGLLIKMVAMCLVLAVGGVVIILFGCCGQKQDKRKAFGAATLSEFLPLTAHSGSGSDSVGDGLDDIFDRSRNSTFRPEDVIEMEKDMDVIFL